MKSKKNGKKTSTADMRQRIEAGMATAVAAARDGTAVLLVSPEAGSSRLNVSVATADKMPHVRHVYSCQNRSVGGWIAQFQMALGVGGCRERVIAELRSDDVVILEGIEDAGPKAAEFVREVYDRAGCGMVLLATAGEAPCAMLKQFERRISLTVTC